MNKYRVSSVQEIQEAGKKIVEVKEMEIGIFLVGENYYAWRNVCPHAGAPVCEGRVCRTTLPSLTYEYEYSHNQQVLRCPWHKWEFDLKTGRNLVDSSVKLKQYEVIVEDNSIYLCC